MRIGMMLRSIDEKGGIGVYAKNIVEELLAIDDRNEYVLLYRSPEHLGTHGHRPNVEEHVIGGRNNLVWDQIHVPIACRRHRLDLIFHPKFTVPLLAPCKTVMVVHGADWFIPDQARFYGRWDVGYVRAAGEVVRAVVEGAAYDRGGGVVDDERHTDLLRDFRNLLDGEHVQLGIR